MYIYLTIWSIDLSENYFVAKTVKMILYEVSSTNKSLENDPPNLLEMFSDFDQHLEIAIDLEKTFSQILELSTLNTFDSMERKLAKRSEETAVQKVYQVSELL